MSFVIDEAAVKALRSARRVCALTGAGVSAESGIPTFRDAQSGLWANFRPEELATPRAFKKEPKLVWEWYQWRRSLLVNCMPNNGHRALVVMEKRIADFCIATQNVDGLHRMAGSENVLELHGNITLNKCFKEGTLVDGWSTDERVPPVCLHCGSHIRPAVVWFEEALPESVLTRAIASAEQCDVFLSIGTSSFVYPAASLPEYALEKEAFVIEVNLEPTPLTPHVHCFLQGKSSEVLPALVEAVWPENSSI